MTSTIIPPSLSQGDSITLLSTARKIDPSQLDEVIRIITEQGYIVKLSQNLLSEDNQYCGSDEQRAADLQQAINDDNCKAILCFRGGYGTVRILEKVNFKPLIASPKWICGYSDVTAIHNALNGLGLASLHCTMPVNFDSNTEEALTSFFDHLSGKRVTIKSSPHQFNVAGTCEGLLIGGNLSMLYSLSGTKYDIDTSGCILFLEDLDEYLYHVDRMMWNLSLSNKLLNIKGLVIGGVTEMNDNSIPFGKSAEEIILEHTKPLNIPVCFGFPAGHIDDNRALAFGKSYTLSITEQGAELKA
ncbi:MAG: muramoyltetrapeptide carboxypeptidase [Parvicella sp.]|jgi:muramoyltetrapeptide carboxypeptidase